MSVKAFDGSQRATIGEIHLSLKIGPTVFDVEFQKVVNGQALANHLAENPVGGEYKPLKTYFPDEEVSLIWEDITEAYDYWGMFFDRATKFKGVGIGAVLVSKIGQHYLAFAKLRFTFTNNMAEYEACIFGLRLAIDMNIQEILVIGDSDLLIHQNEFTDSLATLFSMMQHPDKNYINPIPIEICKQPAYCAHVEEEFDGNPWFHDIKEYLEKGNYRKVLHTLKSAHYGDWQTISFGVEEFYTEGILISDC
ncbi:uncharacterized protein [Nicotiana tomentosiformis]|uniref:uncharacterized protein n=1 Tax=Nicotiana tomentosiformis TaxID=4098 RepID=UPI00388C34FA